MHQNLIFALHGFLGEGKDWSATQDALNSLTTKSINWLTPDLFSIESLSVRNFDAYVDEFIHTYQKNFIVTGKKIFLGYSLGGRLGLHILKHFPTYFDEYVFLSAHPGLTSLAEKEARIINDLRWSAVISDQPWKDFLAQWNAQAVFTRSQKEPERNVHHYDLNKLADAMNLWSLGQQENMRDTLWRNQDKVTWVVGEDDLKFVSIAEDLYQEKILLGYNRIPSGHRILFENPVALAKLLHQLF